MVKRAKQNGAVHPHGRPRMVVPGMLIGISRNTGTTQHVCRMLILAARPAETAADKQSGHAQQQQAQRCRLVDAAGGLRGQPLG